MFHLHRGKKLNESYDDDVYDSYYGIWDRLERMGYNEGDVISADDLYASLGEFVWDRESDEAAFEEEFNVTIDWEIPSILEKKSFNKSKLFKFLNESRLMSDMDKDAMNALSSIMFTPRYFKSGDKIQDYINRVADNEGVPVKDVEVFFKDLDDEDNNGVVYRISKENEMPVKGLPNFTEEVIEYVTGYGQPAAYIAPDEDPDDIRVRLLDVNGVFVIITDEAGGTAYVNMTGLVDITAALLKR